MESKEFAWNLSNMRGISGVRVEFKGNCVEFKEIAWNLRRTRAI